MNEGLIIAVVFFLLGFACGGLFQQWDSKKVKK